MDHSTVRSPESVIHLRGPTIHRRPTNSTTVGCNFHSQLAFHIGAPLGPMQRGYYHGCWIMYFPSWADSIFGTRSAGRGPSNWRVTQTTKLIWATSDLCLSSSSRLLQASKLCRNETDMRDIYASRVSKHFLHFQARTNLPLIWSGILLSMKTHSFYYFHRSGFIGMTVNTWELRSYSCSCPVIVCCSHHICYLRNRAKVTWWTKVIFTCSVCLYHSFRTIWSTYSHAEQNLFEVQKSFSHCIWQLKRDVLLYSIGNLHAISGDSITDNARQLPFPVVVRYVGLNWPATTSMLSPNKARQLIKKKTFWKGCVT